MPYTVIRIDRTAKQFSKSDAAIQFLIESEGYAELLDSEGRKLLQKGLPPIGHLH